MSEDVQPDLSTLRIFEEDGRKIRIYLTVNGSLCCDRYEPATGKWKHLPLREATEAELTELLAVRYASRDEEIARSIQAHSR